MLSICFYFQVHQPYRLRHYSFFDIGNSQDYFDDFKNRQILHKVANKCYLPTNAVLLELLNKYPTFKVSFSFSGVFLQQCEEFYPEVLESFQKLIETGRVEILAETYHHSLASIYSKDEFIEQVKLHEKKVQKSFGLRPKVFRNTELIYNNEIATTVANLGYKGILIEGVDRILGDRSPNFVYQPINSNISLLLKNYRLSDDVAFRFSDKGWKSHPLTASTYAQWVNNIHGNGQTVNLFMDYETFGEHQWESTGIFNFLRHLPEELLKHQDTTFMTPSDVIESYKPTDCLDIHSIISWADTQRDISAWVGNRIQKSAIEKLYSLEREIKATGDQKLLNDWRTLQTSDHFYYMCTKWFNDGDVHKYFNPYDSPYEGFIYFMNAFKDLKQRTERLFELNTHHRNQNKMASL